MPKGSISVQSAKAKARRLQQWTRDEVLKNSKDLDLSDVRSTSMGAGGEDIQLSSAARKQWPMSFECKAKKAFAFYKDYEQATTNCPEGSEPVLVCKGDRKKPMAIVDAEWFFKEFRCKSGK